MENGEKKNRYLKTGIIIIFCLLLLLLLIFNFFIYHLINNKPKEVSVNLENKEKITTDIVLSGDNITYLYRNQEYKEPGFSAINSKNQDITSNVKVESNIDINTPGEYEVKYSVGEENKVKIRKVIVRKSKLLKNGEKSNNSLPVLMYHYFYDRKKGEIGKNANWMEISKFEEQLKYLLDNDYYFPSWKEVEDFVEQKIDLPKKSVVITMDDGNKSIYKLAIPLLDKYKVPATAFIITKKFNTKNLRKYKNSTINFESHTDNMHRAGGNIGHGGIFTALSVNEGTKDLKTSIEKLGGHSNALAYPYGDVTDTTIKAAKNAGFRVAFTTENSKVKPGMNKYRLPRVRMSVGVSIKSFKRFL